MEPIQTSEEAHPQKSDRRRPRSWWSMGALAAVAALTLVLYTWALSRNGMANSYYAAAVKSATVSWKAFFFGSLDPGSFITVDKPPASLWVQALSARLFGFSSWSLLLPQALAGVASVMILYRLVRRWEGEAAALLSALAFALTPVAVLVFRFNNPDALLTLLMLLAAWAVWSALESGSTWKLAAAGVFLGFGFLTKMLEALMVVPALAIVYLICGPARLGRRLLQLLAALVAFVVSSVWWVAVVELWPEATRPYIGGTDGNSLLELIFNRSGGYLTNGNQALYMNGEPGLLRIFNYTLGDQIAWLVPMALVGLAGGLWTTWRAPRTDKKRAGYLMWGIWTVVMLGVFSYATGTFHSYYLVIMAPGIAALAGAGVVDLWRLDRDRRGLAWLLPAALAGTAAWSAALLGRTEGYAPGLATAVLVLGAVSAVALLLAAVLVVKARVLMGAAIVAATIAVLAGPTAYALSTIGRSVTGNQAVAGPATGRTTIGGGDTALTADEPLLAYLEENRGSAEFLVAVEGSAASVPIILATGEPVVTLGGYKQRDPTPTAAQLAGMVEAGELHHVLVGEGETNGDDRSSQSSGDSAGSSGALVTGDSGEVLTGVIQWVLANGVEVDAEDYGGASDLGTLYYLP